MMSEIQYLADEDYENTFREIHFIADKYLNISDILKLKSHSDDNENYLKKLLESELRQHFIPHFEQAELNNYQSTHFEDNLFQYNISSEKLKNNTFYSCLKIISKTHNISYTNSSVLSYLPYLIDNMPLSVFIKDCNNDFRYIYRNNSFNQIISRGKFDCLGKTDYECMPPQTADKFREEDEKLLREEGAIKFKTKERGLDGKVAIKETLKSLVKIGRDRLIFGIVWDITELTLTSEKLKEAKEIAEESVSIKTAMLANISHEIRTPLNSIIGFSQLISEADTKEEREEYFKIVESNNTRLLGLINQILDLSRIDSGVAEFTEEKINVHDFITELHTNYSTFSHDNIKIVVKENLKEGILYSDRNRIFQILSNFINNSLKFTERGIIEIGAIEYPENFEFYIADTGIGISKEKISTIFERFSKIDSFSPGAGLGLAICKSLTEKLGGTISVNSEQGRGSCFKITLPK